MSFYEAQGWQAPVRQASWEQPAPPSRSGASSTSQRDETNAFAIQFEEVDRAIDNLVKGGKFYPPGPRRDSGPPTFGAGTGRQYDAGPRYHGGRHSVSENHSYRPGSASNMQNFYAMQRNQGRPDVDPMMQAKRRMAAQRERELRNYHQEQQYNRSVLAEMASNKSERSMSPSTLSEEGRRELIARQHRALYGAESAGFVPNQGSLGQDSNVSGSTSDAARGASPRGVDPFGAPTQVEAGQSNMADRKAGSPTTQQPSASASTPPMSDEISQTRQISKSTTAPLSGGMGPIGSRPTTQAPAAPGLNKRTTSPLPSSLGYGFGASDSNERAGSANSNNNQKENQGSTMVGWGTGSGVWGSGKIGTTSVWG